MCYSLAIDSKMVDLVSLLPQMSLETITEDKMGNGAGPFPSDAQSCCTKDGSLQANICLYDQAVWPWAHVATPSFLLVIKLEHYTIV